MYVVMSWDVLSVGVCTADWSLCNRINVVMQIDCSLYIYIDICEMSWDVLSVRVSTANR